MQLFADTFTEQLSYMGLLRADSAEALEAAKAKFITGLTVSMLGPLATCAVLAYMSSACAIALCVV